MQSPSSSDMKAEPNLTPLLDMVLQLVMFFMLVANFTMQEVNEGVLLPLASQAKPADKSESDVLYLNINSARNQSLNCQGQLVTSDGDEPKQTQAEIHTYLDREYKRREDLAKARNEKEPNTVVIIRAHRDADFALVFIVLREAKQAGFKKWQLRAQILRS
jgi:biopolymer transport protein ExbD